MLDHPLSVTFALQIHPLAPGFQVGSKVPHRRPLPGFQVDYTEKRVGSKVPHRRPLPGFLADSEEEGVEFQG